MTPQHKMSFKKRLKFWGLMSGIVMTAVSASHISIFLVMLFILLGVLVFIVQTNEYSKEGLIRLGIGLFSFLFLASLSGPVVNQAMSPPNCFVEGPGWRQTEECKPTLRTLNIISVSLAPISFAVGMLPDL